MAEFFEIIKSSLHTRGIRLRVPNSSQIITVSSTKLDNQPWSMPIVQLPMGQLSYDVWRDLQITIEKAFVEYENEFNREPPLLMAEKVDE